MTATDARPSDGPGRGLSRARGTATPLPPAPVTAPGTPRLPAGGRERRPALVALAVLLIVGGALASALLVLRSSGRTAALELSQALPAGTQLTADDLTQADVAAPDGTTIPASQRSSVIGLRLTAGLPKGTLLTPGMLTAASVPGAGMLAAPIHVTSAQVPAGLLPGDHIEVLFAVGASTGNTSTLTPGTPTASAVPGSTVVAGPGTVIVADTVVRTITPDDVGGVAGGAATGYRLTVETTQENVTALARLGSGNALIAKLPAPGAK